jgi:pimeloyl-ACP methyl ester carboxylesterase
MTDVLLLHAGIADRRMWAPQLDALNASGDRTTAPDLKGFGATPLPAERFSYVRDAEALLERPAVVVGCSLGGRVALELAVTRPDLVLGLFLIAPGLTGWDWSDTTRAGWAAEEDAFERGDLDTAAEASVRMWVDGPRRSPEDVDGDLRVAVRDMVLRSYVLQKDAWEGGAEEEGLDPPVHERLGEISCPTFVVVGDEDVADLQSIAEHVAGTVPGARLETLSGVAHLPSLERPDAVNVLLLDFLAGL